MNILDVPASRMIAISSTVHSITCALDRILGKSERPRTFYFEPVEGTSRSERLISVTPFCQSVPMGNIPLSTREVAEEIVLLAQTGKARYDPPQAPAGVMIEGWEVRVTNVQRKQMAYLRTAWA